MPHREPGLGWCVAYALLACVGCGDARDRVASGNAALSGYALTGAGVRVGVWDEGHARSSHVSLASRVVERDLGGWGEHATHTTATLAGGAAGAADALGMAPEARVWAFDWLLDASEMQAAAPGISVSSNAYAPTLGWTVNPACPTFATWAGGAGAREDLAFGRYGREAASMDAAVHRTDLLAVWPAGNERLDIGAGDLHAHLGSCDAVFDDVHLQELTLQFGTIGGAAVGKNVLTVGAVGDVERAALTPARVVALDMSGFGPTADGRIKPDLVVGGEAVRSASAAGDAAYAVLTGTSSATAAAAGAVALLTELYRRVHARADPHAPELKALLVHSAYPAGGAGPDYATGYGLLDVEAAADLIANDAEAKGGMRYVYFGVIESGAALALETDAVPAGSALRATLVWSDPPAVPALGPDAVAPPVLVNDLDLALTAPNGSRVFRPWSLDPDAPAEAAVRDQRNRVDTVEIVDVDASDNERSGRWTIRVSAESPLWRDRAQPMAIVSSVPFEPRGGPVLAAPRYVDVTVALGESAAPVRVPLANRGTGALRFDARSSASWLAVSPASGGVPGEIELEVDASALPVAGEYLASVEIESDDPSGPHRIGVVARVTCAPDCGGRGCGADPRCGTLCGRCGADEFCRDAECVAWAPRCPHASLDSQLGQALVHGSLAAHGQESGSCGGDGAWDVGLAWTAPAAGRYAFTTRGSALDSVLYVRENGCDGPELTCNDDSGDATSAVALELQAGQRVTLFVDAFDAQSSGDFSLGVALAECPNVDLGARPGEQVARASTLGGIDDIAGSCGGAGSEDVAFRWTAPATATYRFALFDPSYQAVLYVRAGDCEGAELGCTVAADVGPVEVDLAAGEAVAVIVDGREGRAGDFTLDIHDVAQSCAGACGGARGSAGDACFCDLGCVAAGDCCADACEQCGHCRCDASCQGQNCGDDGCGGDCGACAADEVCAAGSCVPDACAGVRCAACAACEGGRCVPLAEGAACEDGDLCSVLDVCRANRCQGEARRCDDGFACTVDRCDARTGACDHTDDPGCCEDADAPGCVVNLVDAGLVADAGSDASGVPVSGGRGGCGCAVEGRARRSGGGAWGLVVLALLRRRRRERIA